MTQKPTYAELEQRIKELEEEAARSKRSESTVRESEERFRRLFDTMTEGMVLIDQGGQIMQANPAAERILGLKRSEIEGRSYISPDWEILRPDGSPMPSEEMAGPRAMKEKRPVRDVTMRVKRPDGSTSWINVSASPLSDETGDLVGIVGTFADITKHKRAEEELRKERSTAQRYLDLAGTIFVAISTKGEVTLINQKGCEVLGYEAEEIVGRNWFENFTPEWLQEDLLPVSEALLDGDAESAEYHENPVLTKGGEERVIAWHNIVLRDDDGRIVGHLSSGEDVTEYKRVEAALRESEERLTTILESARDGIFMISFNTGERQYVNQAMADMLGYTKDELLKRRFQDDVDPETVAMFGDIGRGMIATKEAVRGIEYEMAKKDGSSLSVSTTLAPLTDTQGRIADVVGIMRDISDRKRAEEERLRLETQLQQAQKMEAIGTLAGGISHEFNNILGIIMGNTELAIGDVPDGNPARECLEEIQQASLRARDVVRQILSFSRHSLYERKPIAAAGIVEETLKLLRASIPASIDIHQDLTAQNDTIVADQAQIGQIVMNLCTNSAQAMSEGGVLNVNLVNATLPAGSGESSAAEQAGEYLKLTVKDSGHGIDPENMDRIFDPYFTTREIGEGSGLGLSVVNGIVRRHGGRTVIKSKSGIGTTVDVYLPLVEEQVAGHVEEQEVSLTGSERILFVDDEQGLVNAYGSMLRDLGYDVTSETDPEKALAVFREQFENIDLVITDMTMPQMNGDKLTREITKIKPGIPVILCSGYSDLFTEDEASEIGISALSVKPVVKRDIAKTIRSLLD